MRSKSKEWRTKKCTGATGVHGLLCLLMLVYARLCLFFLVCLLRSVSVFMFMFLFLRDRRRLRGPTEKCRFAAVSAPKVTPSSLIVQRLATVSREQKAWPLVDVAVAVAAPPLSRLCWRRRERARHPAREIDIPHAARHGVRASETSVETATTTAVWRVHS